jgi:tetraacyldisaccharide 4'-kinase
LPSHDFINRHLLRRSPLSDFLSPLGSLNRIFQTERRKRWAGKGWQAGLKVISVGNITSGGSGKTPFTIHLAELLRGAGLAVAASHRGYKGNFENTPALVSDGREMLCGPRDAGDEAYMMASRLTGIPVVVGRERVAAVSVLKANFPNLQVVILDDSFQHLRIARDLDIVCFDAATGLGNGRLIPAGYLREALEAVPQDALIVVNRKEGSGIQPGLDQTLQDTGCETINCRQAIRSYVDASGKEVPKPTGKRILLASGIADPDSFERTVKSEGISWLHHFKYPDHHAFTDPGEIAAIAALCDKYSADHLLCTEKDLAKLALHGELKDKLLAVRISVSCENGERLLGLVRSRLEL